MHETELVTSSSTSASNEDTLNNLALKRRADQQALRDTDAELRQQYLLSYMRDVESRGSQSLLNIQSFHDPDEYKLRVERNGETQLVNVDLVETFNWLLGLSVKHIDRIRGVRVVEGTNPQGDRVLVLWRNLVEKNNDQLDQWFQKPALAVWERVQERLRQRPVHGGGLRFTREVLHERR